MKIEKGNRSRCLARYKSSSISLNCCQIVADEKLITNGYQFLATLRAPAIFHPATTASSPATQQPPHQLYKQPHPTSPTQSAAAAPTRTMHLKQVVTLLLLLSQLTHR
ncbi:hypothetical protein [Nostoc sp. PCC 7107]|uniref:hypothetical protein n=1 Tax=Nostoc sp. PCC 7107 TaxID=317936 RepID=UPI0002F5A3E3|nr:hypothetical protein [Nostoc sp. PCC 7107]